MGSREKTPGAPEGARASSVRATAGAPGARERGDQGRFSSRRKMEAVLRLLRGEDLDALSRELGVSGATLGEWRERFLLSGQGGLKSRPEDDRDAEIRRLLAKVTIPPQLTSVPT